MAAFRACEYRLQVHDSRFVFDGIVRHRGCFELRSGQTDRVTAPLKTPIGIDRDADTPTSFKHRM
jgi:hypothetical protein